MSVAIAGAALLLGPAVTTAMADTPPDRNNTVTPLERAISAPPTTKAAPPFTCEYVGNKVARADRKAPIRTGMSSRAPVKAMVKKGQQVRYRYRCVSSKGTHWVKTTAPARGYLYIAHI
ncbi:hypothetical protein [Streptomyces sp. CA-179760]|uniref:hypothetical protein n=1 Tax=Streptomyces sp. CA-179760 TaxID=3240054 RepID=UPI003D9213DE